jgi:hypothetical protein
MANGFVLVITLIMLVLAAVITIALMSSASLERGTARSMNDRYQADLAVQTGLEEAKRALSTDGNGNSISQNDTFIVTRVAVAPPGNPTAEDTTPHYYYLGRGTAGSSNVTFYPLFSGGSQQTIAATAQPIFTAFPTGTPTTAVNMPALLPDPTATSSPAPSLLPTVTTQWIDVIDPVATSSPAPKLRYCYWIEDLGGYVDANAAGNTSGPGTSHTRDTAVMQPLLDAGTLKPPSLIAMWTLFNPPSPNAAASPQQPYNQNLVSQRALLFTSETVKQVLGNPAPSPSAADLLTTARHVVSGTQSDSEQLVIPFGVNAHPSPNPVGWYSNAGQAKIDINTEITTIDVNGIADAIRTNLPEWAATRRGGLPSDDLYRRTIAANLIGYAQPSANASPLPINVTPIVDPPTTGANYRGTGAYPLVSEYFDLVLFTNADWCDQQQVDHCATVTRETFVELWNMSNQTVTGTVEFRDKYIHPLNLGNYTYSLGTNPPDLPNNSSALCQGCGTQSGVTLGPNEYQVLRISKWTYVLNNGPIWISTGPLDMANDTTSNVELYWNGVKVDESHGGVSHQQKAIYLLSDTGHTTSQRYKWTGSLPGFSHANGAQTTFYDSPGDPRSSFYNTAFQAGNDYNGNSSMWGRNRKWNVANNLFYYEVRPTAWADGGPISPAPGPPYVHESTAAPRQSYTTLPIPKPGNAPTPEPNFAPVRLSNQGALKTIAELGNIYDPAQWNIVPTASGGWWQWADITDATLADSKYGGGLSLRVGRPEFTHFDKDGARASQLLDIFSVGTRRETQGLVNLNTASRETLRALGAGLSLNRDPAIQPASLQTGFNPPYASAQADKFSDAVIATRNSRPFISTSQLTQIKDSSGNAFFGNAVEWTSPQAAPTQWTNYAAIEYFSRVFDLASVRSRNFRIFVTGQYVDPRFPDAAGNPKVLATAKKVYQVFLHPTRAGDGSIQSQRTEITYEREL